MSTAAAPARSQWILGPGSDLSCFILSPLYSIALLGLFVLLTRVIGFGLKETELTYFYVFILLFDRPHIVQTFARTHFDAVERKRHYWISVWLLGAAVAYTAFWPEFTNHDYYRFFFGLFGLWHIYAQNMGFLKLYGRRSGAPERLIDLERWVFRLFYWAYFFKVASIDVSGGEWPLLEQAFRAADWLALAGTGVAGALLLKEWTAAADRRELLRQPRLLFFACLGLCYVVNYFAVSFVPVLAMLVFDTFYHDIQYLRWTAHFQERTFSYRHTALAWLAAGVAVSAFVHYGEDFFRFKLHWVVPLWAMFGVVTLYHYLIDGMCWKFHSQPELKRLFAAARQHDRAASLLH